MVIFLVSWGHTLGVKAVVFGWLVFPKEAEVILALITLKIAKRKEVGRWKWRPRFYLVDERYRFTESSRNGGAMSG